MIKSITLDRLYMSMVLTQHLVTKQDAGSVTIDGMRFMNDVVGGRRVIRECNTRLFFDYWDFDAWLIVGYQRVSPLSYENFGVYPQCLDAFHHWLEKALLAACLLDDDVLHDVCEKFGGNHETL